MTLSDGALVMMALYAAIDSSHFCALYSASAAASSAWRSLAATPPSAPAAAPPVPLRSVNVNGGFGDPIVWTPSLPDSGANPGACAVNVHCPLFSPMIEKRPLSSVVAVKLLGEAPGFSAVMVAPLIGLPASSFTCPPTRPVCAAA